MRAIEWADGAIRILDQTLLPQREEYRELRTTEDVAEAIRRMRVRGAPALGIIGALGVAQAAMRGSRLPNAVLERARAAGRVLAATRPTAVNLAWGVERVISIGRAKQASARTDLARVMLEEALAVQSEDEKACHLMAEEALQFFPNKGVVLTHCNTGALCTGGEGTALGAISRAHNDGRKIVVLVTETRPLLQGARLTVWELRRLGIPHALVVDAAAPGLIARGEVSIVVVGADRIAANGDVANKVGTYPLALAAAAAGVPFVVVAPTSSIDLGMRDGRTIPVEERDAGEVTSVLGVETAPYGTEAVNPAFDVTPASLVSVIVTERGIARPPFRTALSRLARTRARRAAAGVPSKPKGKTEAKPKVKSGKKAKGKPTNAKTRSAGRKAAPKTRSRR